MRSDYFKEDGRLVHASDGTRRPDSLGNAIRTAASVGGFCARHGLALIVTVAVPCVLWTAAYIALLVWAMITDSGIGSPLAYPAWLLFFFVAAMVGGLCLLFPSTALAEWIAKRRALPIIAQIPISVAMLAVLCLAAVFMTAALGMQSSLHGFSIGFGVLFVAHLLPLGLYWWVSQSGPLLLALIRRVRSRRH